MLTTTSLEYRIAAEPLSGQTPGGPLADKWRRYKDQVKLVSPANKRKFDIIVVGSGLAGASAAATPSGLGYNAQCFCYQDSPRRAHSIAGLGGVKMYPRTEMLDLVLIDGDAKGIVVRDMVTGKISSHAGDAVVLATGGYGNVFYLSTNAKGCNTSAIWRV